MRICFSFLLLLLITSCAAVDRPNFRTMSAEELAQYNAPLKYEEQIICQQQVRTGSHIKRNICLTRMEYWYRDAGVVDQLDTTSFDRASILAF